MGQIKDDKGVGVCLFAFETDTVSATTRGNVCVINADIHKTVVGIDEPVALGSWLVEIVDVSTGGIGFLDPVSRVFLDRVCTGTDCLKVEHGEEVCGTVVILESIASYTEMY